MKEIISYNDFSKLDLRVGTVTEAEKIDHSDKLLNLKVSLGETTKQIIAGIGARYGPDDIVGKQVIVITNLEPRSLMGQVSEGMLLAGGEGAPIILIPELPLPDGTAIH